MHEWNTRKIYLNRKKFTFCLTSISSSRWGWSMECNRNVCQCAIRCPSIISVEIYLWFIVWLCTRWNELPRLWWDPFLGEGEVEIGFSEKNLKNSEKLTGNQMKRLWGELAQHFNLEAFEKIKNCSWNRSQHGSPQDKSHVILSHTHAFVQIYKPSEFLEDI